MNRKKLILKKTGNYLLDILFPKFCIGCKQLNTYLCNDCLSLIDTNTRPSNKEPELDKLFFITDYHNIIVKKLIQKFKYPPFAKNLTDVFGSFIINYFQGIEKSPEFLTEKQNYIIIPIPLSRKRLKWRGFNQAEEIANKLSSFSGIPVVKNVLLRIKNTKPQANLTQSQRKNNLANVFYCQNSEKIKTKKVLLVDDVYTTGTTMKEAAQVLKSAGIQHISGFVIARD